MLEICDALSTNFEDIDIDPFWNVGEIAEHKNHRIHAYPAKFPAFITQKAIQYANAEGISVNNIADIFCGCGTVAFEAKRLGIDFWGCDLNPTAVLIARAKSNRYNIKTTKRYYDAIIHEYDDRYSIYNTPIMNERINYWFFEHEIHDLCLLRDCIYNSIPEGSKYRYYFLCAFSNILKASSRWLTKSIKPQLDPCKKPALVRQAFINQCSIMEKATDDIVLSTGAKTIIEQKDALTIKRRKFTDLIISSPPYVTSYEYADLHQLSTLWLEFAQDYREIRTNSIGSNHSMFCENTISSLNTSGRTIYNALNHVDKSKARGVANYYYDMQKITSICKAALAENGMMLMVIGNTEYKGIRIDNVKHLVESMQNSGFQRIFVTKRKISGKILTPYRDEYGKFSSDSEKRKVYSEEFIVIGR